MSVSSQARIEPSTSSYPIVSTGRRTRHHGLHKKWTLQTSSDQDGFSLFQSDSLDDAKPSTADLQQLRSPRQLDRKAEHAFRSTGPQPRIDRTNARSTRNFTAPALLENTLKLSSLGISSIPPEPAIAPKVTLSNRSRPHNKVIFDQELFTHPMRSTKSLMPSSAAHSSASSTDTPSFDSSPYNQSTFTVSAAGTNTVTSPSTSSIHIAIPTAASVNDTGGKRDEGEQSTLSSSATISPTLARRAAWTKPRSWADLASRMGPSVLQGSGPSVFSENMNGTASLPQSPSQSRGAQRRGMSGDDKGGRSKGGKGAKRREMTVTEVMKEAETHFDAPLTYPRGMINTGNMCFANAILQVLVYCAPFYNLFKLLGEVVPHDFHNSTPLMEAVIQFLSEFKLIPAEARHNDNGNAALAADILLDLQATSEPFVPDSLYDAMKLTKRFDAMRRGHQEDAEEFLGFFLDTLHEELQLTMQKSVARQRTNSQETPDNLVVEDGSVEAYADEDGLELETERRELNRPASPTEGDGWLEVGQKGKTSFTRTTSTAHSPITRIFGGKLRSVLRTPGSKDSVTLEPYQPLQLDIQPPHVSTIEDALENLTRPETISGVLSSTKKLVDATKQVFIETLPPVLVVHLKRFYYDDVGGVQKSTKSLTFGPTLEVAESVISTPRRAETKRKYNLFGVVYHHGRYANGGHYTVDVLRQDRSEWLHIDDTVWATTSAPQARATKHVSMNNSAAAAIANAAIKPASPKVANGQLASSMSDAGSTSAYLLFYTRADDIEQRGQDMKGISPPISAKKMVEMAASAAANKTNIVPGAPVQARKAGADMTTSKDLRKNPSVPSSPQTARSK